MSKFSLTVLGLRFRVFTGLFAIFYSGSIFAVCGDLTNPSGSTIATSVAACQNNQAITNNGTINLSGPPQITTGVYSGVSIYNNSLITGGQYTAIDLAGGRPSLSLTNSGSIVGNSTAPVIYNDGSSTAMINQAGGVISNSHSYPGQVIYNTGYNGAPTTTTLVNQGSITSANGHAIFNQSVMSIANQTSGVISGSVAGIFNAVTFVPPATTAPVVLLPGNITSLVNNGTITSSGGATRSDAIWNEGNITSLINNGTISSPASINAFAVTNYGTITTLSNTGRIEGVKYGIGGDPNTFSTNPGPHTSNQSSIGSLNNSGQIIGGLNSYPNNYGIQNLNITTLTNTGVIYSHDAGHPTIFGAGINAVIGTLNNAQGSTSGYGPLTLTGRLPSNYNVIINSPTSYGQLVAKDAYLSTVTGTTSFGIYSGSAIRNATYTAVLSGIGSSNLSALNGTYGSARWTLSPQATCTTNCIYDLTLSGVSSASSFISNIQSYARNHAVSAAQVLGALADNPGMSDVITRLTGLSGAAQTNAILQNSISLSGTR